jgi:S-sulfosulfanyl-L-cysteine sulfohydrolase
MYKVAGWAPVAEGAQGEPIADVVVRHLRERKALRTPRSNRPRLVGADLHSGHG